MRTGGSKPSRWRSITHRRGGSLTWYVLAIIVAAFIAIPVIVYFAQAFADGGSGIRNMLALPKLGEIAVNTLVIAAGSTIVATVSAVALAKAVLHIPPRLRGFAAIVPLIPLLVPPVAIVIGWIFLFSPTVGYANVALRGLPWLSGLEDGPVNVYTVVGIMVVTGLELTGIVFLLVSTRLSEIRGPLEAAAQLAGATPLTSFMTITLPLLRPSVIAGSVVVFLMALGQFTAPLLLGTRQGIEVITTTIFHLRESFPIPYDTTAALALPLLALGVLTVVLQRYAIGDQRKYVTQTGGGGGVAERPSWLALAVVVLYALFAVVLPMVAIVLVSFSPFWSGDLTTVQFTTANYEKLLGDPAVWSSISNTLATSVIAVLIALPIGFLAALATTGPFRAPKAVQYIMDTVFQAPLAVPRAALGLAILMVFIRPPFSLYGTVWLFVIGYVIVVLPFMLRSQQGSLVGVSGSLFEAARVTGAGYLRTVFEIALPLVRRGMIAGATLGMVLLSHDFAVSVMVRTPGTHVMGTKLYDIWSTAVYPEVAVMAVIMTVVTGLVLAVTLVIGGRSALKSL